MLNRIHFRSRPAASVRILVVLLLCAAQTFLKTAVASEKVVAAAASLQGDRNKWTSALRVPAEKTSGMDGIVDDVKVRKQTMSIPLVKVGLHLAKGFDTDSQKAQSGQQHRATQAQQVDSLYQGYGTHYVDLWCGTPPQRQTLIVVTGDTPGATGFPCSGCGADCETHHIDKLFQESESSTFREMPCDQCVNGHCPSHDPTSACLVGMTYDEKSSWGGYEVQDRCYIGGPHDAPLTKDDGGTDDLDPDHASFFAFNFTFSCQTQLSRTFDMQLADGILAMDNSKGSFWYQMFQAGKMGHDRIFTICFRKQPRPTDKQGEEAGAMTLGGVDERLHKTPLIMADMDQTRYPSYALKLRNAYVRGGNAGESVGSTNPNATLQELVFKASSAAHEAKMRSTILDSGYTDTYLATPLYEAFRQAWNDASGSDLSSHSSRKYSPEELDALPTLLLQFEGSETYNQAVLLDRQQNQNTSTPTILGMVGTELDPSHPLDLLVAMVPHHYMEHSRNGYYTPRLYDSGDFEKPWDTVLGANFMMGHDVAFDIDHNRLGMAESTCDYTELVEEYYNGTFGTTTPTEPSVSAEDVASTSSTSKLDSASNGIGLESTPTTQGLGTASTPTNKNQNNAKTKEAIPDASGICISPLCRGPLTLLLFCVALGLALQYNRRRNPGTRVTSLPEFNEVASNELELTDRSHERDYQQPQEQQETLLQYHPPPSNEGFHDEPE